MNINGTLLALQMMNGTKVYDVTYVDRGSNKNYSYKSDMDLVKDDMVIVPCGSSVALAKVVGETEDINFDAPYGLKWIVGRVDNLWNTIEQNADRDKRAKAKLVKSKAQTAAKEYLASAGLDAADLLEIEKDWTHDKADVGA